jgi:hypothetical protein
MFAAPIHLAIYIIAAIVGLVRSGKGIATMMVNVRAD